MKELIKNKVFQIVMATDLIQQACIWIRNIAVLFYVMDITKNNPIAVSILSVIEYAPIFLFSFIGGTLSDRWDPRKTMIYGDMLSGVSVLLIIIMISLNYWQAVFFTTFISAIVSQFSLPSSQILFKRHIPADQVTSSIAIAQSSSSLFMIVGPIIGTLVYTKIGILGSLSMITALFFISILLELRLPSASELVGKKVNVLSKEMSDGIKYVLSNHNLVFIACTFIFMGIGLGLSQPLNVYIIMDRLNLNKENLQFFYSLYGIGLLTGGIVAASAAQHLSAKVTLFTGISFFSISLVAEVLSVWVTLTASMFFLTGVMLAFMQIVLGSIMIKDVKEEFIGRTNGLITPAFTGGILLGSAFSGLLMKNFELIPTFILSAMIIFISALLCLKLKTNSPVKDAEVKSQYNL